jgi:hypothetical protein
VSRGATVVGAVSHLGRLAADNDNDGALVAVDGENVRVWAVDAAGTRAG